MEMSLCLLSQTVLLLKSLLLPMTAFLTLASGSVDFGSVCGSRVGKPSDLGEVIIGLSFQMPNTRPFSLAAALAAAFSAARFGEPGPASPLLA